MMSPVMQVRSPLSQAMTSAEMQLGIPLGPIMASEMQLIIPSSQAMMSSGEELCMPSTEAMPSSEIQLGIPKRQPMMSPEVQVGIHLSQPFTSSQMVEIISSMTKTTSSGDETKDRRKRKRQNVVKICPVCSKTFTIYSNLRRHIRSVHFNVKRPDFMWKKNR